MKNIRLKKRSNNRGFYLIEMMVIVAITALFIAATAPIFQEMLTSLRQISTRENREATQDSWANLLRADLWQGRHVTLQTPGKPDLTFPASSSSQTLPSVTWKLDPASPIIRTTSDTTDSKTFRFQGKTLAVEPRPGALLLTITHENTPEPALYAFSLHTGATP